MPQKLSASCKATARCSPGYLVRAVWVSAPSPSAHFFTYVKAKGVPLIAQQAAVKEGTVRKWLLPNGHKEARLPSVIAARNLMAFSQIDDPDHALTYDDIFGAVAPQSETGVRA